MPIFQRFSRTHSQLNVESTRCCCCYIRPNVLALLCGILSLCIAIIVPTIMIADGYHLAIAPLAVTIICAVLFFVGWSISKILLMMPMLVHNILLVISLVAGAVWSFYSIVDPPKRTLFCDDDDDCDTRWVCVIVTILFSIFSGLIIFSIRSIMRYIAIMREKVQRSALQTVTYSTTTCDAIPTVPPSNTTSIGVTQPYFVMYPGANGSVNTNSSMHMNAPTTLNESSSSIPQRSPFEQHIATAPPLEENEKFRYDIAPPPYHP